MFAGGDVSSRSLMVVSRGAVLVLSAVAALIVLSWLRPVLLAGSAAAKEGHKKRPSKFEPRAPSANAMLRSSGWDQTAPTGERGLPHMSFVGERRKAIRFLQSRCHAKADAEVPASCRSSYDVYQFGVYTGRSMRAISHQLSNSHINVRKHWGFDSFEGLPFENVTTETTKYQAMQKRHWKQGTYNAADILGEHSLPALQQSLITYINSSVPVEMVAGYYDRSLTAELATTRGMRPALYVDIDCDLYSSTVTVLTWLFENRLIRKGTILGYDDIRAGGGYGAGEGLAHLQTMEKYGVQVREIAPYCCFEVLSYRDMPAA